jgi:hypothetical protein
MGNESAGHLHGESQVEVEPFSALDDEPVAAIVDYVARRLGQDTGHRQMIVWLEEGRLGHSELSQRRLTREGLELVAAALHTAT